MASDGEQAIALLRDRCQHADPQFDLVLLDLSLPRMSGLDVLAEVKADAKLTAIPLVVLTGSQATDDVERARQLQAELFLNKPADADGFVALVRSLEQFWHRWNE